MQYTLRHLQHLLIHTCTTYIGCENITINCSRGAQCKVDEMVHQAYCESSCDLNNGGCGDDEVCSLLQPVTCEDAPCPSEVQCTCELYMYTICVLLCNV